ncbi:hypothetical protein HFO39_23475 [Rhizobium leguminosarum]|uniref:hypothetical protein n=1 Tax=Rhizobium leguminosarum TaxID=384 RepID=UPI001C95D5B5|nr:hypothetical protein [Rhizobium leguminosarum]MBY5637693.1 hypothetical protein [Rhizobium leguminosarum]
MANVPVWEKVSIFVFGIIFFGVILALSVIFPDPTPYQYTVFRIILSLAAAGIAALVPGFIEVRYKTFIRAGGAIAVFVIVFFCSPAAIPNL